MGQRVTIFLAPDEGYAGCNQLSRYCQRTIASSHREAFIAALVLGG